MKIYDCFMYFDEDLVLDLRLNILKDYVDKFVIAEATRDHAGNEKKLNFDLKNFSKFKDKIEYLIIDDLPLEVSSFKKIRNQHILEINIKEILYIEDLRTVIKMI